MARAVCGKAGEVQKPEPRAMVSVQPLPLSLCSKLPLAAAQAMAMCTSMYLHAWGRRGACFWACPRHCPWLPASPACTPPPSQSHPTLLLTQAKAASGLPSTALLHLAYHSPGPPGELVLCSLCFRGPICKFFAPFPAAAWGPFCSPVHCGWSPALLCGFYRKGGPSC